MPEFVNPFVGMVPGRKINNRELLRALRLSLSAEEEATHIYESLADACDNELARAVLQDIANEEKVHKGEFQKLIEILEPEEVEFMQQGAGEVREIQEQVNSGKLMNSESTAPSQIKTVGNLKIK